MTESTSPSLQLGGAHLRTYQTIFQHPVSHNLEWREIVSLFRHIAEVEEQPNGSLRVKRNGLSLVLAPSHTKDVSETEELMRIRDFIRKSEKTVPEPAGAESCWLLLINHRETRLFRSEIRGSVPLQFHPHEPDRFFRHEHNSKDFTRGQEKPDPNTYFEPIAEALKGAAQILIFGSGTGTGNEMDQFISWLKAHHSDLAKKIVGAQNVDVHHLTDAQLLAKARDFPALHHAPA